MLSTEMVTLSRWQFALTSMFHFVFVPLTIGLSVLLAIMETIYVMTGRQIWRKMTQFWGVLFGINFALGVATGITMEFQFGTNWAYFSQYVGDIFGAPLAIEGLVAFFLEATFVGLFFFGWDRLSKIGHWIVTWLVALGSSLSALWILIANGWMNNPVGARFDFHTMRMQITNFSSIIFNPVAQAKFVHTISAGYVTGAVFVLAISAYYLLRGRNMAFAKRSMMIAVSFGLASALSVVVLGDESGYVANSTQQMKLAAIEGMWHTEPAPAAFTAFGIPNRQDKKTYFEIKIPYLLGLIATRSINQVLPGMEALMQQAKPKIREGMKAYGALTELQRNPDNKIAQQNFERYQKYLGYGLLLKPFINNPAKADAAQINQAAESTIPSSVFSLFWSFRIMVGCGLFFILLFAVGFYYSASRNFMHRWFLIPALWSLPLPWIASEAGWFVAEHGRQPWVVEGVLPTSVGVSALPVGDVIITLVGFILFYTLLAIIGVFLMVKYVRLGPDGLARRKADTSPEPVRLNPTNDFSGEASA